MSMMFKTEIFVLLAAIILTSCKEDGNQEFIEREKAAGGINTERVSLGLK